MFASQRKQQILQILAVENRLCPVSLASGLTSLKTLSAGIYASWRGRQAAAGPRRGAAGFGGHRADRNKKKRANRLKAGHCPPGGGLIQPGQVVIIDGGTTTEEMVRCLPADLACTIVTHSPGIAVALVERPLIEVILIGGRLFKHSVVTVGASALEGIARINADLFYGRDRGA